MKRQAKLKEKIFSVESEPEVTSGGLKLSDKQLGEAKSKIRELLS